MNMTMNRKNTELYCNVYTLSILEYPNSINSLCGVYIIPPSVCVPSLYMYTVLEKLHWLAAASNTL